MINVLKVIPSYNCEMICGYCEMRRDGSDALDVDKFENIIMRLEDLPDTIHLVCGELFDSFKHEWVMILRKYFKNIIITTSLQYEDDNDLTFYKNNNVKLIISLNGMRESHKLIYGDKLLEKILHFGKIVASISFMMDNDTIDDLPYIAHWCHDNGIKLSCIPRFGFDKPFTAVSFNKYSEILNQIKISGDLLIINAYRDYVLNREDMNCDECNDTRLTILPNGELHHCALGSSAFGSSEYEHWNMHCHKCEFYHKCNGKCQIYSCNKQTFLNNCNFMKALLHEVDNTNNNILQPDEVMVILTTNCNLQCEYCFEKLRDRAHDGVMNSETFINVIKYFNLLDKPIEINLFGGEPTTNELCLIELLKYVKCHDVSNLTFTLSTNGVKLNLELISNLHAELKNRFELLLSLDGDEKANLGRFNETTYHQIIKSITQLKSTCTDIIIRISGLVTHNNIKYFKKSLHELIQLRDRSIISSFAFHYEDCNPGRTLTEDDVSELFNQYYSYLNENHITFIEECGSLGLNIRFPIQSPDPLNLCQVGRNTITITPRGDVVPCQRYLDSRLSNVINECIKYSFLTTVTEFIQIQTNSKTSIKKCEECELKSYCNVCRANIDIYGLSYICSNTHNIIAGAIKFHKKYVDECIKNELLVQKSLLAELTNKTINLVELSVQDES